MPDGSDKNQDSKINVSLRPPDHLSEYSHTKLGRTESNHTVTCVVLRTMANDRPAFEKLSSPTNLHQISTGDPASLFHSKVSLLLDSHFPSGSSPIPLVFNDCSPPSCLSPSEVEVVFRKLRGGKAPDLSSALGKTAAALRPWTN
ncbi:hypothetical protein TNCV_1277611 [Trichonephila clavipes]|nr:hypothetical protein TNCV_1277611 [Trichonephila clavipes]